MKKLFTLMGALLLWQSVAVAQNYLHIWTGDSTKIVPMAELDSVTVRDAEFYAPKYLCEGTYSDAFFTGTPQTVSVYVFGSQYIAKGALYGNDLTIDCDPLTGACTVKEQYTGYNHPNYGVIRALGQGTYDASAQLFTLGLEYIVDAGSFGYYTETLQLEVSTRAAAPACKANPVEPAQLKAAKLLSPMAAPQETATKEEGAKALQLMTVPADQTIK